MERDEESRPIIKKIKPSDCGSCPLAYTYITTGEDWCCVLGNQVDYQSIDKDCPIVELKPKRLEWELFHGDYKAKPFYEIGELNGSSYVFIMNTSFGDRGNLDDAKKFCQEHYDKLFREMIGV